VRKRSDEFRIDCTPEEWEAYKRGYEDANDDRDDELAIAARGNLPTFFEGQKTIFEEILRESERD
jgi:hypothetical protein